MGWQRDHRALHSYSGCRVGGSGFGGVAVGPGVTGGRDRGTTGRARQQRPRDALGRPLPYGTTGVDPVSEDPLPPLEALDLARKLVRQGRPFAAHEVLEARWKAGPDRERDFVAGTGSSLCRTHPCCPRQPHRCYPAAGARSGPDRRIRRWWRTRVRVGSEGCRRMRSAEHRHRLLTGESSSRKRCCEGATGRTSASQARTRVCVRKVAANAPTFQRTPPRARYFVGQRRCLRWPLRQGGQGSCRNFP